MELNQVPSLLELCFKAQVSFTGFYEKQGSLEVPVPHIPVDFILEKWQKDHQKKFSMVLQDLTKITCYLARQLDNSYVTKWVTGKPKCTCMTEECLYGSTVDYAHFPRLRIRQGTIQLKFQDSFKSWII